jgi:hypothetical protein
MRAQECLWLAGLLLGPVIMGCSGGRGSSGFDINAENTAINQALTSQKCVDFQGLTICPAAAGTPAPSFSPTPVPSMTPISPTPPSVTPTPASPTPSSVTPTLASPTATATPTLPISRTGTATPLGTPSIATTLGNSTSIDCVQYGPGQPCAFTLTFAPQAFPPATTFRVLARAIAPDGPWLLGGDPVPSDGSGVPSFDAPLALTSPQGGPPAQVQSAILAFAGAAPSSPMDFQQLRQTDAAFAFVTQVLAVNVVTAYPPLNAVPQVSYFGLTRADEVVLNPAAFDSDGRPIFIRSSGQGISLVVEARPGTSGVPVGIAAFDPSGGLPDLQMLVSRPLGNGSEAVCDKTLPNPGGVPATDPLGFSDLPEVIKAMNDLGCRVDDGAGQPFGRMAAIDACTVDAVSRDFRFVNASSTTQYCLPIDRPWGFASGDTVVAARVRDVHGEVSLAQEIVVRVLSSTPSATATRSPTPAPPHPTPTATATMLPSIATPTRTPTAVPQAKTATTTPAALDKYPAVTYLGLARADGVAIDSTKTDANGRRVYLSNSFGVTLVVEARPGIGQVPVGRETFDPSGGSPDLQILVSQPLGDGSPQVCDKTLPNPGGVPATDPLAFSDLPVVINAMNDLGCRVDDGAGQPFGRAAAIDACTVDAFTRDFRFVNASSATQYCLPIDRPWRFASGDTIVAARVRDRSGVVGLPTEIVVRVVPPLATDTPASAPSTTAPVTAVATPTRTVHSPTPVPASPVHTPSATPSMAASTPVRTATQPTLKPSHATSTPTATPRTTPEPGPVVTYMGVARADGVPVVAVAVDADGRPVYSRVNGSGMILVIEARPGTAQVPVGRETFDSSGGSPDLQILVSQPLGNGSPQVCDKTLPNPGGVPPTDPLVFSDLPAVINAMNDLGCRVDDGAGQPFGRAAAIDACTVDALTRDFRFVNASSTTQYCLPIYRRWGFASGDTIVAARVRDQSGVVGLPTEIVVRVVPPS